MTAVSTYTHYLRRSRWSGRFLCCRYHSVARGYLPVICKLRSKPSLSEFLLPRTNIFSPWSKISQQAYHRDLIQVGFFNKWGEGKGVHQKAGVQQVFSGTSKQKKESEGRNRTREHWIDNNKGTCRQEKWPYFEVKLKLQSLGHKGPNLRIRFKCAWRLKRTNMRTEEQMDEWAWLSYNAFFVCIYVKCEKV